MFGTIIEAVLPLILRTFRLDPVSVSAPAVATIVDVSGLVIYFSIRKGVSIGKFWVNNAYVK
jgi:magnesium transporter